MNASHPQVSDDALRRLDEDGFVVLPDFAAPQLCDRLQTRIEELFELEGDSAGSEFRQEPGSRRLANLMDKGRVFHQCVEDARLREFVSRVLGRKYKLSSVNVRSVNPRWPDAQPLHADMGAVPDERGFWVCNSVWFLDDVTQVNGAIRVIPGSHRWGRLPQDELADPKADHPQQVALTGARGTVVVMNAHAWHGGMPNGTDASRTALHVFFTRRDKPQQQYQKRLLSLEVQRELSVRLRDLLALDDEENDRLCRGQTGGSGFLK